MDNLIELIIFLIVIWQISSTLKKVFKPDPKNKDGSAAKASGWQDKLRDVAEKIKEEIEAQNARANAPSGQEWEKVAPEKKKKDVRLVESQKKPSATARQKTFLVNDLKKDGVKGAGRQREPLYTERKKTAEKSERVEGERILKGTVDAPEVKHMQQRERRRRHRPLYQFKGLKKAIIWKEILDTPPGLREDMRITSRSKAPK